MCSRPVLIFLTIGAVILQTAICAKFKAQYVVELVQVLGDCNSNAPEKYWDQVNKILGLDFSADPGT